MTTRHTLGGKQTPPPECGLVSDSLCPTLEDVYTALDENPSEMVEKQKGTMVAPDDGWPGRGRFCSGPGSVREGWAKVFAAGSSKGDEDEEHHNRGATWIPPYPKEEGDDLETLVDEESEEAEEASSTAEEEGLPPVVSQEPEEERSEDRIEDRIENEEGEEGEKSEEEEEEDSLSKHSSYAWPEGVFYVRKRGYEIIHMKLEKGEEPSFEDMENLIEGWRDLDDKERLIPLQSIYHADYDYYGEESFMSELVNKHGLKCAAELMVKAYKAVACDIREMTVGEMRTEYDHIYPGRLTRTLGPSDSEDEEEGSVEVGDEPEAPSAKKPKTE
jgi:hypothetical protein